MVLVPNATAPIGKTNGLQPAGIACPEAVPNDPCEPYVPVISPFYRDLIQTSDSISSLFDSPVVCDAAVPYWNEIYGIASAHSPKYKNGKLSLFMNGKAVDVKAEWVFSTFLGGTAFQNSNKVQVLNYGERGSLALCDNGIFLIRRLVIDKVYHEDIGKFSPAVTHTSFDFIDIFRIPRDEVVRLGIQFTDLPMTDFYGGRAVKSSDVAAAALLGECATEWGAHSYDGLSTWQRSETNSPSSFVSRVATDEKDVFVCDNSVLINGYNMKTWEDKVNNIVSMEDIYNNTAASQLPPLNPAPTWNPEKDQWYQDRMGHGYWYSAFNGTIQAANCLRF